jgi:hypothetical protein
MDETGKLITEHYQKTYELTLQVWEQRNRTFLLLLAAVGAATLLTFKVSQAEPLLVDIIAKTVDVTDDQVRLNELRQSFPYGVVQSILLMVILYLMVVLYHRTVFIRRCYDYLAALEPEIKTRLDLPAETTAFTRESTFYQKRKAPFAGFVAPTYIAMLGCLLVAFLGARVYADFSSGNMLAVLIEVALAAPTLLFFVGYARSS